MKKIIVLSFALGVLVTNSFILKDLATDANLSSKDVQHEQVASTGKVFPICYLVYGINFALPE